MSKYIQSFYQYPVTFSSIGKTIPACKAAGEMKNIAEVSDKEFLKLENCEPRFRELVNQKKYRVLNHIPASYVPANEQINRANAEAERVRKENEELRAKLKAAESNADDGLEGERGRDAVAGVDEEKKTNSSKKGKK